MQMHVVAFCIWTVCYILLIEVIYCDFVTIGKNLVTLKIYGVKRLEKEYSTIRTKELEEQVELRVNSIIGWCYLACTFLFV